MKLLGEADKKREERGMRSCQLQRKTCQLYSLKHINPCPPHQWTLYVIQSPISSANNMANATLSDTLWNLFQFIRVARSICILPRTVRQFPATISFTSLTDSLLAPLNGIIRKFFFVFLPSRQNWSASKVSKTLANINNPSCH